jgi:DNA mismatch repair protein MutL
VAAKATPYHYQPLTMSIQALPPAAVRLIGATQVITDASSLVKELIDNALDARSTSIQIEISANTLDTIQVRDNGHGVAPDDRDLLCKRYCTSKIRDFGDLRDLGGTTLGFRGEALASACEIAGDTQVTTRVEGEDVASCLKSHAC